MINSLIDEINSLLSRPVGSVTKRVCMDIVHPRDQLKRLRSHLEKLTEDTHLNNLDQQYQGLLAHLQEKIYANRQTSHDISAESKKLEALPPTVVKSATSKLFGNESDLSMETSTTTNTPTEENSTFFNDRMIASRQQLMDRLEEKQIRTVQQFANAIGDFSELWGLLKNKEISIYHNLSLQGRRNIVLVDSNHKITRHGKGRVVGVDYENPFDVKIKIDFYPNCRFINPHTGYSQSAKLYTKSQFVAEFREIHPPLSLVEVEMQVLKKRNRLESIKKEARQRELESLKHIELTRQINILFEDLENVFEQDFDSCDFFYDLKCSKYISFESYNNRKLVFLERKKKDILLKSLEELLIQYLFVEADELYKSQCQNYINLSRFSRR